MNIFKFDLMTVLIVVVIIGVIVTMSSQANEHTMSAAGVVKVSSSAPYMASASKDIL